MKKCEGRRSRHGGHSEGEDEHEKKAKTAPPDICNDVCLSIFSRLTARDAARCAALSKRHRQLVGGVDFWLHRRLGPPLPSPSIAYMATVGASDPTSKQRRPAPAPAPLDHVPAAAGYMFFDFHLAGGRPGGDNDELRYTPWLTACTCATSTSAHATVSSSSLPRGLMLGINLTGHVCALVCRVCVCRIAARGC